MTAPTLDYRPSEAPTSLTLHQQDGAVRLTWPVAAKWVYLSPIYINAAYGLLKLTAGLAFAYLIERSFSSLYRPTPVELAERRRFLTKIVVGSGAVAAAWWSMAAYYWLRYRRWGRVPSVLSADAEALTYVRLGRWRMREQRWAAAEFEYIELRPIRWNLNRRKTEAFLYFRRRRGRRLRFLLSSPDPDLPGQIARQFAAMLGRPLR